MRIVGIDFVTSPSTRAPMYIVSGEVIGDELHLTEIETISTGTLQPILARPGPWVLGLDVPFSLPTEFIDAQGWSRQWPDYVTRVGSMHPKELNAALDDFRAAREAGAKEPRRPTDQLADSLSPLKVANPPLSRMFQAAAPILVASDCDVLPFRRNMSDRTVVEVYPKLIANRLAGGKYKNGGLKHDTTTSVRRQMIDALLKGALKEQFGFSIRVAATVVDAAISNEPGEAIDSLFSAVEAAWSFKNRDRNWGIPTDGAADSGWIVDPGLVRFSTSESGVAVSPVDKPRSRKSSRQEPTRFQRALLYAARAHAAQMRKGTPIPYVSHLLMVAGLVLEFGGDEDEAIGGLLHDAVEDAGGRPRLDDIRSKFGDQVAEIVEGCTDADVTPKPEWRGRKERYLEHLQHASHSTRLVSAADKLANVRSIVKDYRSVGEAVWSRFKGGRDGTLWYYGALASAFTTLGPTDVAVELAAAVRDLVRLADSSSARD